MGFPGAIPHADFAGVSCPSEQPVSQVRFDGAPEQTVTRTASEQGPGPGLASPATPQGPRHSQLQGPLAEIFASGWLGKMLGAWCQSVLVGLSGLGMYTARDN